MPIKSFILYSLVLIQYTFSEYYCGHVTWADPVNEPAGCHTQPSTAEDVCEDGGGQWFGLGPQNPVTSINFDCGGIQINQYTHCDYNIDTGEGYGCVYISACSEPEMQAILSYERETCENLGFQYDEDCVEIDGVALNKSRCNESCSAHSVQAVFADGESQNGTQGYCTDPDATQLDFGTCEPEPTGENGSIVVPIPPRDIHCEINWSSSDVISSSGDSQSSEGGSSSDSQTSSEGDVSSDAQTSSATGSSSNSGGSNSSASNSNDFDDTRIVERLDTLINKVEDLNGTMTGIINNPSNDTTMQLLLDSLISISQQIDSSGDMQTAESLLNLQYGTLEAIRLAQGGQRAELESIKNAIQNGSVLADSLDSAIYQEGLDSINAGLESDGWVEELFGTSNVDQNYGFQVDTFQTYTADEVTSSDPVTFFAEMSALDWGDGSCPASLFQYNINFSFRTINFDYTTPDFCTSEAMYIEGMHVFTIAGHIQFWLAFLYAMQIIFAPRNSNPTTGRS
jgi:hypothetical protein